MKLSIVIPVFNEADTIEQVIARVEATPHQKEMIIVDDGSTDGTAERLRSLAAMENRTIIFHEKNQGKGAALRTAFQHVTGDVVIVQDADLEYDPRDYDALIGPIFDGRADVVYGSRFLGGPHRVLFFWHYVGNKIVTLLSNMLTNLNLTDLETGYKVFRSSFLQDMEIRSHRFGFDPEITAKFARMNARMYEVPISYSGRGYEEGKKLTWRDGVAAIYHVVRFWLFD